MLGPRDRRGTSKEKVDIEALEQDNDRELDHLGDRVALLKNLTHGINKEADSHHKILDHMDTNFLSARGLMTAVTDKFRMVYNDKGNKQIIYGVVGVAVVLFLLWYFMRR